MRIYSCLCLVPLSLYMLLGVPGTGKSADDPAPERTRRQASSGSKDSRSLPDSSALRGAWKIVKFTMARGRKPQGVLIDEKRLHFLDDNYFQNPSSRRIRGLAYRLNTQASPKRIDLQSAFIHGRGMSVKGIYRLAGDDLTICYGPTRPETFEVKRDSHAVLLVLKRDLQLQIGLYLDELGRRLHQLMERSRVKGVEIRPGTVADLLRKIRDRRTPAEERAQAISRLGKSHPDAKTVLPDLVRALKDRDDRVVSAAMITVTAVGLDRLSAVDAALAAQRTRKRTISALVKRGVTAPDAPPSLVKLWPNAASVIPVLAAVVKDARRSTDARLQAIDAAVLISPDARQLVDAIASATKDTDEKIRDRAVFALGTVGRAASGTAAKLVAILEAENESTHIRVHALRALSRIGPASKEAVPALVRALRTNEGFLGLQARVAVAQLGAAAVPALTEIVENEHAEDAVRRTAIEALASIGPEAEEAVPALIKSAKSERFSRPSVKALGSIGAGARAAVPELERRLKNAENAENSHRRDLLLDALEGITGRRPKSRATLSELAATIKSIDELTRQIADQGFDENQQKTFATKFLSRHGVSVTMVTTGPEPFQPFARVYMRQKIAEPKNLKALIHLKVPLELTVRIGPELDTKSFAVLKEIPRLKATVSIGPELDPKGLAVLKEIPKLKKVWLSHRLEAAVINAAMAHLGEVRDLESLGLDRTSVTDADLAQIANLTKLKLLLLERTSITDAGLAQVGKLRDLESLSLNGTSVTDAGLAQVAKLSKLKHLQLNGTSITDAGLALVGKLTNLELILLNETSITDAGMVRIANLSGLKTLDVAGTSITDAGLVHLERLRKLKHLSLVGTNIGDEGLRHLAGWHKLERLRVNSTKITDAGLAHLQGLRSLTYLAAAKTAISDVGLKQLAKLPALTRVNLSRTKVTNEGVSALKKARPEIKVLYTAGSRLRE